MFRRWLAELVKEEAIAQTSQPEKIDELVRDICSVHSFFVLTLQNTPLEEDTNDDASWEVSGQRVGASRGNPCLYALTRKSHSGLQVVEQLLTSFLFLRRRHTWNKHGLPIPEHELYQVQMCMRRSLV